MTTGAAWIRRMFFTTISYYGDKPLEVGDVYYSFKKEPLSYIYVGKRKLWITSRQ